MRDAHLCLEFRRVLFRLFASRSERLAIEVDGDTHATQVDYDLRRTAWLEAAGYHVIRFTNAEVMENLEGVATMISRAIEGRSPSPQPSRSEERRVGEEWVSTCRSRW